MSLVGVSIQGFIKVFRFKNMERFLLPCCQAVIIKLTGKYSSVNMASPKRELFSNYDELKFNVQRLQQLNHIAYGRIDELHETIFKMEERMRALTAELRNVRNFSVDMLNDYQRCIQKEYEKKLEAEQRAAQEYAYEMEQHFQEMVEWQEHIFDDSDEHWSLLLNDSTDVDSYDTVDLTSE